MQAVTLERRIRDLERTTFKKNFLCVHETETVPPVGVGGTYVTTHEFESYRIFVCPLRLHGHLSVFRASAVISSTLADGTAVDSGMAIYRYNNSPHTFDDPILASEPYSLTRIAFLGSTITLSPEGNPRTRFNADLIKGVTLDPRRGVYFIAYTTSEYGRWLCPGYSIGQTARRNGRQTEYVAESAVDFPRELTVNADAAPVPWIALRSSLGVRLYGDVADYG